MTAQTTPLRVAIHSAPRSGSTWLGQVFNSSPHTRYAYQPLFSYAFKDALDARSTGADVRRFFAAIAATDDEFVRQADHVRRGLVPAFAKDGAVRAIVYKEVRYHHLLPHLLEVDEELRAIGLVRHPLAVLDSWRRAPREFRADLGWDFLEQWRSGSLKNEGRPENFFGYDKWKEVAATFVDLAARFPSRFRLVRYADLLADPHAVVADLFAFCGLPIGPATAGFLDESRSRHSDETYSVFRRKAHDRGYRERLPASIQRVVEADLADTPLARFLT
jgi:hypothetical protein